MQLSDNVDFLQPSIHPVCGTISKKNGNINLIMHTVSFF